MPRPQLAEELRNAAPLRAPVLRDAPAAALLFLVSRASVLGTFPFSMAFFAACFDKTIAYLGVTVMCIGLMSAGAGVAAVRYMVAALIYWLFDRLRPPKLRARTAESAACGISVCIGGLFVLLADFNGPYDILILLAEGIIAALMYLVFFKADTLIKTRRSRAQAAKDEIVSTAISAGVIITGFHGVTFPLGISLSGIAAVYAVISIAYHSTLSAAGSGGLCIGFMSAMNTPDAMSPMGFMGISGLFANLLKSFGRIGAAAGMALGTAAAVLYSGYAEAVPVNAYESAAGIMLFLLTPTRVHNFLGAYFANSIVIENVSLEMRVKDYLTLRLQQVSDAFSALTASFTDASDKRLKLYGREFGTMLDDITERVCADCPMFNKCWQSEFSDSYRRVSDLLAKIEREGILLSAPDTFAKKCARSDKFISEFNHVYEIYKRDTMRRGEAISGRDLLAGQYGEVSRMLKSMSEEVEDGFSFREDLEEAAVAELDKYGVNVFEISVVESTLGRLEIFAGLGLGSDIKRVEAVLSEITGTPIGYDSTGKNGIMRFVSKPRYSADFAVRQRCRDHSRVCGDSVSVIKTGDYRMYFIISDGMGSGKKASEESKITIKLLSDFLKAGFGVKTAIEMINSALCLKLGDECFATIDLLCLDLMTGYAEFYKIGAAQSFVYSEGKVDTLFSASIPAGMLAGVKVTAQRRRLDDGDTVIMVSDGVSEAGFTAARTEWIKKELTSLADNMADMADNILHKAMRKNRDAVIDDMSVIAIRVLEE